MPARRQVPDGYHAVPRPPGVLLRDGAEVFLRKADGLFLDIDGVLMDVRKSYREATVQTVANELHRLGTWRRKGVPLRLEEIDLYKAAGGFNNDWDLAAAVVLWGLWMELSIPTRSPSGGYGHGWFAGSIERRGGGLRGAHAVLRSADREAHAWALTGWDPDAIRRLFQGLYAGRLKCRTLYGFAPRFGPARGLMERERPLATPVELRHSGRRLGIITGRTRAEASAALERLRLRLPRAATITDDGGLRKPDPRVLTSLATRLGVRQAIYVGDTRDDLETVARTKGAFATRFEAVWVTGKRPPAPEDSHVVRRWRPAAIVPTLRSLLEVLRELDRPRGDGTR